MKRVKVVLDRPNRLFETWLEEWKNEAALRNSDLQNHFAKALDSLKRYPLPLESGRDCIILQHFGSKLCSMLDKKLEKYRKQGLGNTADVCVAVDNNEECAIALEKPPAEEDTAMGELQKKTAMVKQSKNTKKNASKKLANASEVTSGQTTVRQIQFEPHTFDIMLLVDTQEICG